jgi:hypothetical protein
VVFINWIGSGMLTLWGEFRRDGRVGRIWRGVLDLLSLI